MPLLPFKLNQAGRHHIPRHKHKVPNWREYDASLRQRGSLTVLCGRPERGNGFRLGWLARAPVASAWHSAATARLHEPRRVRGFAGIEAPIGVGERSGQLRPYVRPHMGVSPSSRFRGLTWGSLRQAGFAASGCARVPGWPAGPRRSSRRGRSPHQPHIRRDRRSRPRSRIRDGGAPRGRHHSIGRRGCASPDNGDAPSDRSGQARRSAAPADVASQAAGSSAAPSGMTPRVANLHSAIRSFRASATTMTLRRRRAAPPRRSRNQPTIALPGW
jgi:hypothetical protein